MENIKEQNFNIWIDRLSDGRSYSIIGKIISNNVIFYLPFEPTISDFSIILQTFRKINNVNDNFNFKKYIQPIKYGYEKRSTY